MPNNIPVNQTIESKIFLLRQMVNMRLFAEFKHSFLGWAWLIIYPLFTIATWLFIKQAGVINPGETEVPYYAYVLLGIVSWGFFFEAYKNCSNIFNNYGKIVLVNKLPLGIIVLSEFCVSFIKFLIPFSLTILFFLISGISIHIQILISIMPILILGLLGTCLGLLIGTLSGIAKDFSFFFDNIMRLVMLLTPIIYSPKVMNGTLAKINFYNPLNYLINSIRNLIFEGTWYEFSNTILWISLVIILFALILRFFIKEFPTILERSNI
ncbi:MAG: ABC transporter permease [Saprospiraceae bacterium]